MIIGVITYMHKVHERQFFYDHPAIRRLESKHTNSGHRGYIENAQQKTTLKFCISAF